MNSENSNEKRARRIAVGVTLLTLAAAVGLWVLYRVTRYLPLCTAAALTGLPALITLILSFPPRRKAAENGGPAEAEPVPEKSGNPGKKAGALARFASALGRGLRAGTKRAAAFCRARYALIVSLLALVTFSGVQFFEVVMLRRMTSLYQISYLTVVVLLVLFVIFVILEKICRHTEEEETDRLPAALLGNIRSALAAGRLALILIMPCMVIRLLGFYDLQKILSVAVACVFYYVSVLLLLTYLTRLIRRELAAPDLRIPVPFSGGADLGILGYLEANTGITMRSLWSLKLIRGLLPYALLLVILLLWGVTGIVQIGAGQSGALYHFGRLAEEPLAPGLHFVLPYPFDRVAVYDTEKVQKLTIGYRSDENTDNLWTATHGTSEFRLLLGSGNEVVSINLRIEYRIADLIAYLRGSAEPERMLEAHAYELITRRTISTDLDTLISADREAFAADFAADLERVMSESGTGLRIVSVVLESIHPPIEIAGVYQELIGAEVLADKYILQAEGSAASALARAEAERDTAVGAANAEQAERVAAAVSDVAQFEAAVAADGAAHDAYAYTKYLQAVSSAYGNARLILVGEGVNSKRIIFGTVADAALTEP